ncbi:MAG: lytic transglycosylase domain-containing protein [Clostridia bacterium]|nr:lytic transglycosylase domain-containing protein [Clostridia bacterium]
MNKHLRRAAALVGSLALLCGMTLLLRYGYRRYLQSVYPLRYQQEVEKAAQLAGLSPSLLFAVMRTESEFDPAARSAAGACGLMQLTEETYQWAAGQLPFAAADIWDAETNICCGALVLQRQYRQFGNWEAAFAAYNAGGTAVKRWLADPNCSADGKTLQYIPYRETRDFVQRVFEAQRMYQTLYALL